VPPNKRLADRHIFQTQRRAPGSRSCYEVSRWRGLHLNLGLLGSLGESDMTHFEYLAVSFSIVLSFAVVRILAGISDVFARGRVYWVHAAWVLHLLLFLAYYWWNIWSYRDVSWNFITFLTTLAGISLIYYQVATVIPAVPAGVASWQEHFYTVRTQFFGAQIAWALTILFNTSYILHVSAFHGSRVAQVVTLLVGIAGVSTHQHRIHGLLVTITLLLWPIRMLVMLQPGSLVPK
jgi:hypothetical protein